MYVIMQFHEDGSDFNPPLAYYGKNGRSAWANGFVVGFFEPNGYFVPFKKFDDIKEAAYCVNALNGGDREWLVRNYL